MRLVSNTIKLTIMILKIHKYEIKFDNDIELSNNYIYSINCK